MKTGVAGLALAAWAGVAGADVRFYVDNPGGNSADFLMGMTINIFIRRLATI